MYIYKFICNRQVVYQIEEAFEKHKTFLNLKGLEIEEYPLNIAKCKEVQKLHFQNNHLTHLDIDLLKNFIFLTSLSVDYNKITKIPKEICELTSLVNLNLSYNPLKELPSEIGMLKNLEALFCHRTEISEIPEEIGQLKKLQIFGARGNNIKVLPESITKLKNLTWLTLENNLISELPVEMKKLRLLIHLNLKMNNFTTFPTCVTKCKYLKYAFLSHNKIEDLIDLSRGDMIKMKHLIYIDIQDNPCVTKNNIHDDVKGYSKLRVSKDWNVPAVEQEDDDDDEGNNGDVSDDDNGNDEKSDSESISEGELTIDSVTIDSDDWETSILTSQLDSDEYVDGELQGIFIDDLNLQGLSRFAGTGS